MSSVFYEELCPKEFVERIREFPVAYLPLGTLEWHGLHMPLGADGLQSRGAMRMIAEKVGGIVLPMFFLGPDTLEMKDGEMRCGMDIFSFEDGHAQQLPGSAYFMEDDLFSAMLDCTIRNLARAGFKVIVAHGHGPSNNTFAAMKAGFEQKYNIKCYSLFELAYPNNKDGLMTDHAAANETSITMALHPEMVHPERIAGEEIPVASWGSDPRKHASAEFGHQLLEKNVARAVQNLEKLKGTLPVKDLPLQFEHVKSKLEAE